MKMRHINAFERDFDITVERVDKKLKITVSDKKKVLVNKVIKDGDTINITLK
jgi:hypothetical protein